MKIVKVLFQLLVYFFALIGVGLVCLFLFLAFFFSHMFNDAQDLSQALSKSFGLSHVLGLKKLGWSEEAKTKPLSGLLFADLTDGVTEGYVGPVRAGHALRFFDVLRALSFAKDDPRISGLVIRYDGVGMSLAQIEELSHAVLNFKKTGKPAYIFARDLAGEANGIGGYYFASAFSKIFIAPYGSIGMSGISVEQPFIRALLDKVGIIPWLDQRYEYKGGVDTFKRSSMSPEVRSSLRAYFETVVGSLESFLNESRPVLAKAHVFGEGPYNASEALASSLVDGVMYEDKFVSMLDKEFPKLHKVDIGTYVYSMISEKKSKHAEEVSLKKVDSDSKIAVIYAEGIISDQESALGSGLMDVEHVITSLGKAAEDKSVKAVVLRVDSRGGSYTASMRLYHAVHKFQEETKKPIIVSMGNYAASGGYLLAVGAKHIFAYATTLTGSIGVYSGGFTTEEAWKKLGVDWDRIRIGKNAGFNSMIFPLSTSELEAFNKSLDFVYKDFTKAVVVDRRLSNDKLDSVARGRIWSGEDAKVVGLVDDIGGLYDAISYAAHEIGSDMSSVSIEEAIESPESLMAVLMYLKNALIAGSLGDSLSVLFHAHHYNKVLLLMPWEKSE